MPGSHPVFELIPEATDEVRTTASPWLSAMMRIVDELELAAKEFGAAELGFAEGLDGTKEEIAELKQTTHDAKLLLYWNLRSRDQSVEALASRDRA